MAYDIQEGNTEETIGYLQWEMSRDSWIQESNWALD